jgi:uncharacterized membrane protein (UPF0127 family)
MPKRLFKFLPLLLVFLVACSPEDEPMGMATVETWLPLSVEGATIETQVALTPVEMSKGLMHRESLGADQGMFFPYRRPQQMSFWMANTPIPLDIGFFDGEGVLMEIHRMYPYDTNRTRSRSFSAQFALEMNAGWYAKRGILPGARLDMEEVARVLRERGVDPRAYGIDPSGR